MMLHPPPVLHVVMDRYEGKLCSRSKLPRVGQSVMSCFPATKNRLERGGPRHKGASQA